MLETQENADGQFRKYFADTYFGLCQKCKRAGVCGEAFCSFASRPFGYIEERIAGSSPTPKAKRITVGFCRVSTLEQKDDLERQKQVVQNYCENNGYRFKIMSDIGSGINFRRRSFC